MYDMNEDIRNWKLALGKKGTTTQGDLEELENHLIEEIEGLKASGLSEKESFMVASHRLGGASELANEFGKVNRRVVWVPRLFWICVGVLSGMVLLDVSKVLGQWAVLLAASQIDSEGMANAVAIVMIVLGSGVMLCMGLYCGGRFFKKTQMGALSVFGILVLFFLMVKGVHVISAISIPRLVNVSEFTHVYTMVYYAQAIVPVVLFVVLLVLAFKYRKIAICELGG